MVWLCGLKFRQTTILLCACAAFLLGIVSARQFPIELWPLVVLLCVFALISLRRKDLLTIVLVSTALLFAGLSRGTVFRQELGPYHSLALSHVTLQGTATIDGVYGANSQLTFTVNNVRFTEPYPQTVPGMVKVSGFGTNMVYRGDQVIVSGKLYPTRGANQASIGYGQIQVTGSTSSLIDSVRRKFAAGMQSALPEPLASFGLGLLVGQRNTLPADVSQTLLMVGLTHIIAVSGYNLTILLEASKRFTGKRSKRLSVLLSLALIGLFLLFAGTSASIVRAAVISVLSLAAWYYGRSVRPLVLILLAAAITTYANPIYIWSDISWYLSFLAFFGVLVLGPQLTARLFGDRQLPLPAQIVVESACAEIMTLPLILYTFGQMSFIGLVANMLVAALIPLAMLLSLLAGLAGMLFGIVSGWVAWPAALLLTYMLDVATLLSRIPHVFVQNHYISAVDMVGCYASVVVILYISHMKLRRKNWFSGLTLRSSNVRNTEAY